MAKEKLFYGSISDATVYANGNNGFIRVRFNAGVGDTTLTNCTDQSGYFGLSYALVGQQIAIGGSTLSGGASSAIITAVDVAGQTIDIDTSIAVARSNYLARISPPKGQYFITGSVTSPTNVDFSVNNITGSDDTNFDTSQNKYGVLLLQASTSSLGSAISGDIAQYEISQVRTRPNSLEFSAYVTSSTVGILSEEPGKAATSGLTDFALVELSYSSSIGPIFNQTVAGTPAGGYEFGAYQIALQEYFDDLRVGIFHSSSLIEGNADFINFTGSAVKSIVTESINGQNGVLITIEGGDTDIFPYTGSAQITGSLGITGSFEIESGSTKPFKVNADGVVQLFAHENSYNPTPVLGGIYFTSESVFLGLED